MKQIVASYANSKKAILFLDYDGTLSWFKKDPEDARPDQQLYDILKELSSDKKNRLVIISGRDKETLGRWFDPEWNIHFIAEHGVWLREPEANGTCWNRSTMIGKSRYNPLLEYYVDRTPKSFIEHKNFSLVWHYRNSDPDLGLQRAWELKDELRTLTSNLNLEIMDGDKVLEIKYSGINKGRAALQNHRRGPSMISYWQWVMTGPMNSPSRPCLKGPIPSKWAPRPPRLTITLKALNWSVSSCAGSERRIVDEEIPEHKLLYACALRGAGYHCGLD